MINLRRVCERFLVGILTCGIVFTLSASTILTPLWLDSVGPQNETNVTFHNDSRLQTFRHVDGFSIIFIVNLVFVIVSGVILLHVKFCFENQLTDVDKSFPKLQFFWIGFADALSSICFVYASGGTRTAPYLQSLAINFAIPVTFIIRFLLLRKRPSGLKIIAAAAVLIAEFIALIPSIFPSLQSTKTKEEEGGASGVAGVLWPLCYALGYIPQGVLNVVIERSTKSTVKCQGGNPGHVHPLYLMFWSFFFCFVCVAALFWTDIIPGFGMADGISDFANVFLFNLKCLAGLDSCTTDVYIFAWTCMFAMFMNRILTIIILRFSEGANYLVIIQSLQTPLVLLFWTLFEEHPFQWKPSGHLSTWLSLVAVVIMLPAIYVYNRGAKKTSDEDKQGLVGSQVGVDSTISYQSIQADSMLLVDSTDDYTTFRSYRD